MRFGVCIPYKQVTTLQHVPFDYLEENVQRFLIPEQPDEDFVPHLQAIRNLPLPVEAANSLLPASLPIISTPTQRVDTARLDRYIHTTLRRAEKVGIRVIVFGSGTARMSPAGYDKATAIQQVGAYLAQWSIWGEEHGVTIALEPLRYEETNILNTVAESGELVESIRDSEATLLADTYHMACNGESPEDVVRWASLLSHVHVAEKQERAAPGRFGENLRPYFSALHQVGYDKRISIECNWRDFATEVAPAIATLREQWQTSITTMTHNGDEQ